MSKTDRGVAQFGSVPLWGSGGRGFESRRSDNLKPSPVEGFTVFTLTLSCLPILNNNYKM